MIRQAKPEDSRAIAEAHVASWQTTYVGQVPNDYLSSISLPQREAAWQESFNFAGHKIFISAADQVVKGFVSFGPSRDANAHQTGEIYAIYLRSEYQRAGIGRQLWNLAIQSLQTEGFKTATVWVLDSNTDTRKFYETIGCKLDGATKPTEIGGRKLVELRYRISISDNH